MANYDELLLTVSNYNASKAQTDEPEVVTEKVNSDTVLNFGLIAAGIAAISALVAKIISDNKVKKIIKNDETLSALVDKIENTKSKLADLRSEYLAVENEYSEKISEYNEYAKIFGSKTVKFESITKVPEPTVEDPDHMKTVKTTTTRPNENFDPEKAKRYKALAKELNVLADKARNIRSEISREYAALQGYIKQIKKEVRKYKYASEDTVAQVNSKCDDFINDIDDFEEKLKKFPVVESSDDSIVVVEYENDPDVRDLYIDAAKQTAKMTGVAILKGIAIATLIRSLSRLLSMVIRSKKALKTNKNMDSTTKSKTEALEKILDENINRTKEHFKTLNDSKKQFTKLFNALRRSSNEEEFDKIKKDILALESDIDKAFSNLYNIFETTSKKVEEYTRNINDDNHPAWTVLQNIEDEFAQIDRDWTEVTEYFREFKSTSYKDFCVKESNNDEELGLLIMESFIDNEITEDEYDILMSSL